MGLLEGKVAVVLGAGTANNMGQSIARRFAREGASVMVAGRDAEVLSAFAKEIGGDHAVCEITDPAQLELLMDKTVTRFGKLNIAVNATGLNHVGPFLDMTLDDLRRVTDVQFTGTVLFMQSVLRRIADGGCIIQLSSVSATALLPNHAAYMATKAAGDVIVRALANEFGERGIRINSIAPGPTEDAPMASAILADEAVRQRIRDATPLRRLGKTEDVANAALWLATDNCFMTGEVLQVNGGRALNRLG